MGPLDDIEGMQYFGGFTLSLKIKADLSLGKSNKRLFSLNKNEYGSHVQCVKNGLNSAIKYLEKVLAYLRPSKLKFSHISTINI